MQEIIVMAVMACWLSEWSKLIQTIEWWYKGKVWVLNCAKCTSFWSGLVFGLSRYELEQAIVWAVLTSASAMVMNKIYMRL